MFSAPPKGELYADVFWKNVGDILTHYILLLIADRGIEVSDAPVHRCSFVKAICSNTQYIDVFKGL